VSSSQLGGCVVDPRLAVELLEKASVYPNPGAQRGG